MAEVYFVTLKSKLGRNLKDKIKEGMKILLRKKEIIDNGDLVAIKVHFGEWGNLSFIRPQFVLDIVEIIREKRGKPFLTDTNTLYKGTRTFAPDHLITAIKNGFGFIETGAPIIIADGIKGHSSKRIKIDGDVVNEAVLAAEIVEADSMVVLSHFKGHELTGFGGALKNLGMGCAAREGKLFMHSTVSPKIKENLCTGCGRCISICPADAIYLKNNKAVKEEEKCIGCADCIIACLEGAISISWNETAPSVMKKVAEYAMAVSSTKKKGILFLNFLMQISPLCDCYGFNDTPVAPDIGVCLSFDPVAIDQASIDLVIKSLGGKDPFKRHHNRPAWEVTLEHAEKMGLGSRSYDLKIIE